MFHSFLCLNGTLLYRYGTFCLFVHQLWTFVLVSFCRSFGQGWIGFVSSPRSLSRTLCVCWTSKFLLWCSWLRDHLGSVNTCWNNHGYEDKGEKEEEGRGKDLVLENCTQSLGLCPGVSSFLKSWVRESHGKLALGFCPAGHFARAGLEPGKVLYKRQKKSTPSWDFLARGFLSHCLWLAGYSRIWPLTPHPTPSIGL